MATAGPILQALDFSGDLREVRAEMLKSDTAINNLFLEKMQALSVVSQQIAKQILDMQKQVGDAATNTGELTPEQLGQLDHFEASMANLMLYVAAAHTNIKVICNRDYQTDEEATMILRQINSYDVDLTKLMKL